MQTELKVSRPNIDIFDKVKFDRSLKLNATSGIRIGYLWLNKDILYKYILPETSTINSNIDYYSKLTHVIVSFANPLDSNGNSISFTDDSGEFY